MLNNRQDKIRTLIVDDEPLARDTIRLLLNEDTEIELVGECTNGAEAVETIRQQPPDLLFLDVQMPEVNGFQLLERVGVENMPPVIFVTAYDEYALKAFEVQAVDYLVKPFTDERFRKALRRAKTKIQENTFRNLNQQLTDLLEFYKNQQSLADTPTQPTYVQRIAIKLSGRIYFVNVDEIDWIEAADQYVKIHSSQKTHLLRESMNYLENKLDPQKFLLIHRSTIVNVQRIHELQHYDKGDYLVILRDRTQLKLSRNRREKLEQLLG